MTTFRVPILGFGTLPDTSGNVFFEPTTVKLTTHLYPHLILVFNDTATKLSVAGSFLTPHNYVSSPKLIVRWATTATTGNVQWDFDYRSIASTETFDPTTHQESVNSGAIAVPGTAKNELETSVTLTAANLGADKVVEFLLSRDGASANDTAAAAVMLIMASLEYADV